MTERDPADAEPADVLLARSERAGLRLAILIRTVLLTALALFSTLGQDFPQGLYGAGFAVVFLLPGLLLLRAMRRGRDRSWMRYGLFALDTLGLAVGAVIAPMSTGGAVPQIFVFRVFGVDILYFVLAMAALSLSPRLVLVTGALTIAALWSAFLWITAGMERTLTWADLPPSAPAEVFVALVLDPDFTALGNRVIETFVLAATAALMAGAVSRARRLFERRLRAERARSAVTEIFGRFVPVEVVARITRAGGTLPPENRVATVLFLDIEGFTRFSETTPPDRLIATLDAFFDRVGAVVGAHRGTVISLIGDAAMATFNAPLENDDHAADALASAKALLAMSAAERFDGIAFPIRVGVATGPVAAGTVGGQGRRAYTLYGDTVNLAQRLEAANKAAGTRLILSAATWEGAGQPEGFERRAGLAIRGRGAAEDAYLWHPDPAVNHPAPDVRQA
ncbi:MAG: adenylate/guanylate cyclase domain-containing protein [Pseudomonadota bacterium]